MFRYCPIQHLQNMMVHADEAILACAVKFGKTRLIDNTIMSTKDGYHVQNDDEQ